MRLVDPARQEQARRYARIKRRLYFVELGLGVGFLLLLLTCNLSSGIRDLLPLPLPLQVGLYAAIIGGLYGCITFPFTMYESFLLPKRYGLSLQTLQAWLKDLGKATLLMTVLGLLVIEVLYWLLGRFPHTWWVWAALFIVLMSVVLAHLAPVLIVPLFFKFRPLEDTTLAQRLTDLAKRTKTPVGGVFTLDMSTKGTVSNAALMGLGSTRRIMLTDTLLGRYTADEIEVILAHELAHHVHRDLPKGMLVESATTALALWVTDLTLNAGIGWFGFHGLDDIATFPLLALVLGSVALVTGPIRQAYSRRVERAADVYALEMTDKPRAFISMMSKLADQNLAEWQPSPWVEFFFFDHPPIGKRVALAQSFTATREKEHG